MTTNDKPVCYQIRVQFPEGDWSDWHNMDSAAERDERAEQMRSEWGHVIETRDLYDRPQPAAPQVPEGWVLAPMVPTAEMRDAGLRAWTAGVHHDEALAIRYQAMLSKAPPAPEQPKQPRPADAKWDGTRLTFPSKPAGGVEIRGVLEQKQQACFAYADDLYNLAVKAGAEKKVAASISHSLINSIISLASKGYAFVEEARLAAQPAQGEGEK